MSWSSTLSPSRLPVRLAIGLALLLVCVLYLLPSITWTEVREQPAYDIVTDFYTDDVAEDAHSPPAPHSLAPSSPECVGRFDAEYLHSFVKRATKYCDADSTANLTCFSHNITDNKINSICIGGPASLATEQRGLELDCVIRDWSEDDLARNIPQFHQFPP